MVSCSDVARLGGGWPASSPEAVSPAAEPDGSIPTESGAWSPNDATADSAGAAGIPIARPSLATPSDPPFRLGAPRGGGGNDAREPLALLAPRTQSVPTLPPRARADGDTYATPPPPPPPRVGLMLLWVPALAASTGLRLHPRSSPGREGLRLRQVGHGGRSAVAAAVAAAAAAADGVP